MHRGSGTGDFEEPCAGTDMVTVSVFMQIHNTRISRKNLLWIAQASEESSCVFVHFFNGCGAGPTLAVPRQ